MTLFFIFFFSSPLRCQLENPLESCCCVGGGPCGDIFAFAGGACGEIGNLCGDGIDGLGDCVSSVCGSDACNQLEVSVKSDRNPNKKREL